MSCRTRPRSPPTATRRAATRDYDVKRAQALVAQVASSIPTLEGQRRAALFELTALLGRTPAEAPQDVEACRRPPQLTALMPVGDGAALIRRRPDVRQAERRLAAATAQIGVATADLYPTIRLAGFYGGAAVQVSQLDTEPRRDVGHRSLDQLDLPEPGRAARARSAGQGLAGGRAGLVRFRGAHRAEGNRAGAGRVRQRRSTIGNRSCEAQDRIHASFDIAHNDILRAA